MKEIKESAVILLERNKLTFDKLLKTSKHVSKAKNRRCCECGEIIKIGEKTYSQLYKSKEFNQPVQVSFHEYCYK